MKRCCIIFLLMACSYASAQSRDALLERINQIKLDTERYLYGICTLTQESTQSVSEKEALEELSGYLADYCTEQQFSFIHRIEDIPDSLISFISCQVYENSIRSVAYLSKHALKEIEDSRAALFENEKRAERIRHFVEELKECRQIEQVQHLLQLTSAEVSARYGTFLDDSSQEYVARSFLVYYNPDTGVVWDIMTPGHSGVNRRSLYDDGPADPLQYKTAPLWIYIIGFSLDL